MSKPYGLKSWLLMAALFAAMVLSVRPFSWMVRSHIAENYTWQTKRAIDAGNLHSAAQILSAQMPQEHYDFTLHRLYAQVLMQQQRPEEAVKLLQLSIDRERAISGRKVFNRGYNSYESHEMLSQALAAAGDASAAGRAFRKAKEKWALRGEGILPQHK